jgi:hypothetical protein
MRAAFSPREARRNFDPSLNLSPRCRDQSACAEDKRAILRSDCREKVANSTMRKDEDNAEIHENACRFFDNGSLWVCIPAGVGGDIL